METVNALRREMERVTGIAQAYEGSDSPATRAAARTARADVREARKAIESGSVRAIVGGLALLRGWEPPGWGRE